MVTDPLGDFIVRLVNGGAVKKIVVSIPFSNLKLAVAEKLKDAGFIKAVEKKGKKVKKTIDVTLNYNEDGSHFIKGVKRVSKPGRRMYVSSREAHPVRYGFGALVISTSKGIMTDKEARKAKMGGEALFQIW